MQQPEFSYTSIEVVCADLKIVFITDERSEEISPSCIHMHSFWELFHLVEGSMTVTHEGGTSCTLEKDQMLVIPPNTYHSSVCSDNASKRSIFFTFEKVRQTDEEPLYDTVIAAFALPGFLKLENCEHLAQLLSALLENTEAAIFAKSWRLRANVVEFILSLYEKLENLPDKQPKNDGIPNAYWVYKYAIDRLLDMYFINDINLEFLSKKLFVSPQNLTRIISTAYGKSFKELKQELKMRNAKQLLRETDVPIREIGERVGYTTLRGFLSAFVKYEGCTPNEYRKTHAAD